jgi:hypothetical protein
MNKTGNMSQRDRTSQHGKGPQETGRKYVTDGQNFTNRAKEGGHDVTSDDISTLRQRCL